MTKLAPKLRTLDYFSLGFGSMVGVGWLVVMDDWLARGGPLGARLGFALGGRRGSRPGDYGGKLPRHPLERDASKLGDVLVARAVRRLCCVRCGARVGGEFCARIQPPRMGVGLAGSSSRPLLHDRLRVGPEVFGRSRPGIQIARFLPRHLVGAGGRSAVLCFGYRGRS